MYKLLIAAVPKEQHAIEGIQIMKEKKCPSEIGVYVLGYKNSLLCNNSERCYSSLSFNLLLDLNIFIVN